MPESVGEWLEALATTHIRHPPPTDWRGSGCLAPVQQTPLEGNPDVRRHRANHDHTAVTLRPQ
jgi:hypothetical protein